MATGRKATVSLCMIVRNEEANLAECLAPVAKLFDEIVIVDTGSQDQTREIAARYTPHVHEFEWCDDFSAARNESLRHATGDWVFWLDADDRLSTANIAKLKALLDELDDQPRFFMIDTVLSPLDPCEEAWLVSHPRLFRRHPQLKWRGRVHEQLRFDEIDAPYALMACDIRIDHVGYQDAALCRRKMHRKLRLLRMDYAVDPDDETTLFHLGLAYAQIHNFTEARKHLLKLIDVPHPGPCVVRVFTALAEMSLAEGQFAEALQIIERGLARFPDNDHLQYIRAQVLCQLGRYVESECALVEMTQSGAGHRPHGMELGNIRGKLARRLLGDVLRIQNKHAAAEAALSSLVAEFPSDTLGWYVLGLTAIDVNDGQKLQRAVEGLAQCPRGGLHGRLLMAAWHMRHQNLDRAGGLIDQLISEAPQMAYPRMLRCEWLSRRGAPLADQILALRDLIRVQPANAEALQWLETLQGEARRAVVAPAQNDLCTSVILMPGMP